jgi:ribonuclease/clavin/mitogillin
VLLGARTEHARSWPGTLAFPGGAVDDDDHLLPLLSGARGENAAFRGAALREAFEEAGLVSFARADGSRAEDAVIDDVVARLRRGEKLIEVLGGSALALDDRPLHDLGAWLTAEGSFLVARFFIPVDVAPLLVVPPTLELSDVGFQIPSLLMDGWRDGRVFLPPPIRTQLGRLAGLDDGVDDHGVASVLRARPLEPERRRRDLLQGVVIMDPRTPTLWPATTTNCVVLGCGDVLLVDPATPYPEERASFDEQLAVTLEGRRVQGIVLTHHHHDHVGDAERLRELHGCPVYAHAQTADQVDVTVDVVIDHGHAFELAGGGHGPDRRFEVVFTPGHARGHVCLFEPSLRLLVAGDMVAGVGSILIDPPEGHMATYLASLDRLMALDPRSMIPAHGPLLTNAMERLALQKAHRLARQARVHEAIRSGANTLDSVVSAAYGPDTPGPMLVFAARSVLAIVEMLMEEGAVTVDDSGRWLAA